MTKPLPRTIFPPRQLEEIVEELRVSAAQKRRDVRFYAEELRKWKERLKQSADARDFLRDRQRISEEKYDLRPSSHRQRIPTGPRSLEDASGKKVICRKLILLRHSRVSFSLATQPQIFSFPASFRPPVREIGSVWLAV